VKEIKSICTQLNNSLKDRTWLVGNALTIADIIVFTSLIPAFQLVLDAGFRKAAVPALDKWFERLSQLPVVTSRVGFIKPLGGKVIGAPAAGKPAAAKKDDGKQAKGKKEAKKEEAKADDDDFDPFADEEEDDGAAAAELKKKAEDAKKKKAKAKPVAKSLIIWEVKPWGPETDLDALGKKILAEVKMDGLEWKTEFKKEPVAYGVFKIVIGATVEDEKVSTDDVQEQIEAFEDYVQSVDIVAFNKL
jgi:translation elongation factor EF-1beta